MEKIEKILARVSFISILFFIVMGFIYFISISPYDELWNFQNVYKMYNGFDIYIDANVIVTPLFYMLSLGFFKLFGATIVSFRFLNIILFLILFALIYLIFKYLKVSKHLNVIFLGLIFTQLFQVINNGASYSILVLIFVMLGMLLYFHFSEKKYFHFLQGLIIYLVFFSKQNIGVYYAISIIIYEFIYKRNFKSFCINQFKKLAVFLPVLLISLCIIYCNGILFDFINYAFGGLFNFGTSNLEISVYPYLIIICISVLALYFFVILNKKVLNEKIISNDIRKNFNLIACIMIGVTFSVFPILNSAHFIFIIPFYLILLFYFFDITILEELFSSEKSKKISYLLTFIMLILIFIRIVCLHYGEEVNYVKIKDKKSPYNNIYVLEEYYNKIKVMSEYIQSQNLYGKNVVIISYDSAFTMINLKQNNQVLDLVFDGNIGYDGDNKVIEKIKSLEDTKFLIFTDEKDCFWQESKKVREYIINNLTKTGEILDYSIYE